MHIQVDELLIFFGSWGYVDILRWYTWGFGCSSSEGVTLDLLAYHVVILSDRKNVKHNVYGYNSSRKVKAAKQKEKKETMESYARKYVRRWFKELQIQFPIYM